MIQRIRRKAVDSDPIPKSLDFELTEKYKFLEDWASRLLVLKSRRDDSKRNIVFAKDKNVEFPGKCQAHVHEYNIQVGSQHLLPNVGYSWTCGNIYMPSDCLIPDEQDSRNLQHALLAGEENSSGFHEEYASLGKEMVHINSLRQNFINTNVKICIYHMDQASFRQVQSLGLMLNYLDDPDLADFVVTASRDSQRQTEERCH